MGVAASYVSKVELGQLQCRPDFCRRLGLALNLPPADRRLLAALAALQGAEHRRVPPGAALAHIQRLVRRFEASCRTIRVFQFSLIPGLLQTRAYMRAIFSRLTAHPNRGASIKERLARQAVLAEESRSFRFLVADWALAPHWCTARVMAGQINRLEHFARKTNIDLRVLPYDLRFPADMPLLVSGFEVLDEALVLVDTQSGFATYRQPEDVAAYVTVFDSVFSQAVAMTSAAGRS
jgi:hypothetical protein